MKHLFHWFALLLLLPLLLWLADVQDRPTAVKESALQGKSVPEVNPPVVGSVANILPESKENTQLADSMAREIQTLSRRDSEGLVEEIMPDGSARVRLQQRFQHVPVATLDESGRLTVSEH